MEALLKQKKVPVHYTTRYFMNGIYHTMLYLTNSTTGIEDILIAIRMALPLPAHQILVVHSEIVQCILK